MPKNSAISGKFLCKLPTELLLDNFSKLWYNGNAGLRRASPARAKAALWELPHKIAYTLACLKNFVNKQQHKLRPMRQLSGGQKFKGLGCRVPSPFIILRPRSRERQGFCG